MVLVDHDAQHRAVAHNRRACKLRDHADDVLWETPAHSDGQSVQGDAHHAQACRHINGIHEGAKVAQARSGICPDCMDGSKLLPQVIVLRATNRRKCLEGWLGPCLEQRQQELVS